MTEPTKGTQAERLLTWMRAGHKVTPLDSWELLGIYRLSDVVFKLRKNHGFEIFTHDIDVPNKYGETITVGEYELITNQPAAIQPMAPIGGHAYQDEMFKVH